MNHLTRFLPDEATTQSVGEKLAHQLSTPLVIALNGPLGAGKSTLIRAMLRKLGVTGPIKSPTYALVEPYNFSNYSIYHFDFYRFFDENEWGDSGFRDYFNSDSICLVEWAEKAGRVLPPIDLGIDLQYAPTEGRTLNVHALSKAGEVVLQKWSQALL
ncbi:MAG: tRNA (adenosine(37)-N6)-threonylcarbamoyltransferase complex ATPase subunit type 1 TsaE [Limnobacter sp.]|nr:tRNA (adenosine(37)-N6)-threonylcarbamoyltransferase complex ATPase subunit type 1 TsaE [Limnobacter sp.]